MPIITSNGKAVHKGGGTGVQDMGGTPPKDPLHREFVRGLPKEGRDRGAKGRNKKMAKAMEEWLRMGKTQQFDARGAKEGKYQRTREELKEEEEK